jgi:hypothetical protein
MFRLLTCITFFDFAKAKVPGELISKVASRFMASKFSPLTNIACQFFACSWCFVFSFSWEIFRIRAISVWSLFGLEKKNVGTIVPRYDHLPCSDNFASK